MGRHGCLGVSQLSCSVWPAPTRHYPPPPLPPSHGENPTIRPELHAVCVTEAPLQKLVCCGPTPGQRGAAGGPASQRAPTKTIRSWYNQSESRSNKKERVMSVRHGICDRVVVVLVGAPNGHSHGFVEGAPFRCAAKMTEASKVRFSKFPIHSRFPSSGPGEIS